VKAAGLSAVLALGVLGAACGGGGSGEDVQTLPPPPPTPAALESGEALFGEHCQQCHGEAARGTDQGPPLVHKIYEPSHHADFAFLRAVQFGVAAHHWRFGNMPPVTGVTRQQITEIVGYVRWLQREAGIF
jgi:mono/diheme cytochrome c family protein